VGRPVDDGQFRYLGALQSRLLGVQGNSRVIIVGENSFVFADGFEAGTMAGW
jgi:hypothetical protein